jgi:hypothetical protein
MCPDCHGRMPRCRSCEMQDVTAESTWLRDTEHLARFAPASSTPVVRTPVTGTLTMILESALTASGTCSVTWESSVAP